MAVRRVSQLLSQAGRKGRGSESWRSLRSSVTGLAPLERVSFQP